MLQAILVAAIVTGGFLFSCWKLMPARRRLQLLLAIDAWSARRPRLATWRMHWLKRHITRAAGVGCDGCAANESTQQRPR
jgi:hypothetical protein